jgi:hypothetical protein
MRAAVLALLLTGCFEDRYTCTNDAQCDVGEGGRCEPDGHCSQFDPTCPTGRRYAAHAEERTGTCFDDRIAIANVCAGGQGPAVAEGCAATVCGELPACCDVGWSDACVEVAQLRCDIACTTEIAVSALRGARDEAWQLTWQGDHWTAKARTDFRLIAWVGPAPGETDPREAGVLADDATLVVGNATILQDMQAYQSITTVPLDRDGRDTAVATFRVGAGAAQRHFARIAKIGGDVRDVELEASLQLTWGDTNRDGFPDGIVGVNQRYFLLENVDGDAHVRSLSSSTSGNFAGMTTNGSPALRDFAWIDIDGDGALDLVAFGSSIRVHTGPDGITDLPLANYDCDPPGATCPAENFSFAGTALPTATGPRLAVAPFEAVPAVTRKAYLLAIDPAAPGRPGVTPLVFADTCPTCPPLIAITARDLDGDHALDLIALDKDLRVYTGLAANDHVLEPSSPIVGTGADFNIVHLTVTGRPR